VTPGSGPGVTPRLITPTRRALFVSPVGLVVAVVAGLLAPWQVAPLIGWAAGSLVWLAWTWVTVMSLDAAETRSFATRVDPLRPATDLILITAAVASLVAVVLGVIKAGQVSGDQKLLLLGAGVASIVASWAVTHTVYALRYAALYHGGTKGGIEFPGGGEPTYKDFAYVAFTIGMTYQVSDTNLTSPAVRHAALRHALLSYVFGTVIIAATINIATGLAH
jgi:uncharacterized membrane protein